MEPYLVERGYVPQYAVTVEGHIYRLDFARPAEKLFVEVDGQAHSLRRIADRERTERLIVAGWIGIRFWNSEVRDKLPEVLVAIW